MRTRASVRACENACVSARAACLPATASVRAAAGRCDRSPVSPLSRRQDRLAHGLLSHAASAGGIVEKIRIDRWCFVSTGWVWARTRNVQHALQAPVADGAACPSSRSAPAYGAMSRPVQSCCRSPLHHPRSCTECTASCVLDRPVDRIVL